MTDRLSFEATVIIDGHEMRIPVFAEGSAFESRSAQIQYISEHFYVNTPGTTSLSQSIIAKAIGASRLFENLTRISFSELYGFRDEILREPLARYHQTEQDLLSIRESTVAQFDFLQQGNINLWEEAVFTTLDEISIEVLQTVFLQKLGVAATSSVGTAVSLAAAGVTISYAVNEAAGRSADILAAQMSASGYVGLEVAHIISGGGLTEISNILSAAAPSAQTVRDVLSSGVFTFDDIQELARLVRLVKEAEVSFATIGPLLELALEAQVQEEAHTNWYDKILGIAEALTNIWLLSPSPSAMNFQFIRGLIDEELDPFFGARLYDAARSTIEIRDSIHADSNWIDYLRLSLTGVVGSGGPIGNTGDAIERLRDVQEFISAVRLAEAIYAVEQREFVPDNLVAEGDFFAARTFPIYELIAQYIISEGRINLGIVYEENIAPTANDNAITTQAEQAVSTPVITFLSNDFDADDDPLELIEVFDAQNGEAVISGENVIFTPDQGFSGITSFRYRISDGRGGEDTATVSVIVRNDATPMPPQEPAEFSGKLVPVDNLVQPGERIPVRRLFDVVGGEINDFDMYDIVLQNADQDRFVDDRGRSIGGTDPRQMWVSVWSPDFENSLSELYAQDRDGWSAFFDRTGLAASWDNVFLEVNDGFSRIYITPYVAPPQPVDNQGNAQTFEAVLSSRLWGTYVDIDLPTPQPPSLSVNGVIFDPESALLKADVTVSHADGRNVLIEVQLHAAEGTYSIVLNGSNLAIGDSIFLSVSTLQEGVLVSGVSPGDELLFRLRADDGFAKSDWVGSASPWVFDPDMFEEDPDTGDTPNAPFDPDMFEEDPEATDQGGSPNTPFNPDMFEEDEQTLEPVLSVRIPAASGESVIAVSGGRGVVTLSSEKERLVLEPPNTDAEDHATRYSIVGDPADFHESVIINFSPLDEAIMQGVVFNTSQVTFTVGSVILDIDTSGDGVADTCMTFEGLFDPSAFNFETLDGNTMITTSETPNVQTRILGSFSGVVVENDLEQQDTSGQLIISSAAFAENGFTPIVSSLLTGKYGEFTFDSETGAWTYSLDNEAEAVQALPEGVEVTDTLTVTSLGGTASETITITILGTGERDAPDLMAKIDGMVQNRGGNALEGVSVTFSSDQVPAQTAVSDSSGGFGFEMDQGISGHLHAARDYNSETDGSITARDALDVLRLAVGIAPSWGPASPMDFIAADINQDGQVTAADALDVLRAAVGLQSVNQPRWVFLDSEAELQGIDRTNTEIEHGVTIDPLVAGLTEVSMTGVLLGSMQEYA